MAQQTEDEGCMSVALMGLALVLYPSAMLWLIDWISR